jgi:heptaprenyl diphosphate synthase
MNIRKLLITALLVSFALILSFVETFVPVLSIPGAKLGLANIATLLALYMYDFKTSIIVVLLRIMLAAFMFTHFTALIYSLSGGIISLAAMYLTMKLANDKLSIIGVSIIGAIFHNIAQLAVAVFVLNTIHILLLAPYLMLLGIVTGIFTGISSKYLLKYSSKVIK